MKPLQKTLVIVLLFIINSAYADTCEQPLAVETLVQTAHASGYGMDPRNTQLQSNPGFSKQDIANLALDWVFAIPKGIQVRSQPVITEQAIFFGTQYGDVYALDRESGCTYWKFNSNLEIRTALSIGPSEDGTGANLYFGDFVGNVFAIDAGTGELIWKQKASNHSSATITGAPTLYNDVLYVPVSSFEIGLAAIPFYPCCRFQGQVVAFNAYTGEMLWRESVFVDPPTRVEGRPYYWPHYAPSGATVWSSPTIDAKRNRLYVGTDQSYMHPAGDASDAIIAFDLTSGEVLWRQQTFANDVYNLSCITNTGNCPDPGSDFDYGAPPILTTTSNGKDIILAGQKSGMVSAMDPDNDGAILWQNRVGAGGALGGVHWGMAVEGDTLYVPISDVPYIDVPGVDGELRPGVYALDINSGRMLWEAKPQVPCGDSTCVPHFSAAAIAVPGAVFASDLDGTIWAFDVATGETLWSFNSDLLYLRTVNKKIGYGGCIDAAGQVIGGGRLIVMSGYSNYFFSGKEAGNALVVLAPQQ